MAGIVYPREKPRSTDSLAEPVVWRVLGKSLPDGWVAYHSLRLRVGSGWEGEGDFVIANPHRGFLVLEVKGGRVELHDGRWFQNGREMKPPREQAHSFAKNLARRIRNACDESPPWGIACAFPDVEFSDGPTSGDLEGLILGGRHLDYAEHSLPLVLEKALPKRDVPEGGRWLDVLHSLWGETWVPRLGLRDRVNSSIERVLALDAEQLDLLDCFEDSRRFLIEGQAGSGKTILAREICRRRALAGERVLFLCFTNALAATVGESLAAELGDRAPAAFTVRRYAQTFTSRDELADSEWQAMVAEATDALRGEQPSRWDFVVVDEGQDFAAEDWAFVEALVGDGCVWVFRDSRQGFWPERAMPSSLTVATFRLLKQRRNPPAVFALAESYVGGSLDALVVDESLRLVVATEPLGDVLKAEVGRLLSEGAELNEIAILSAAGQTRSEAWGFSTIGDWEVRRSDDPDAHAHLVVDTFLRFKGLERPFVIVVEPKLGQNERYETRMHIATTRATVGLVVVCSPEALQADARLSRLAELSAEKESA